jgi:cysteine desulfurase
VPLLVHAIQAIGHDPAPAVGDVVVASARDWGGPAGVGAIAVRPDGRWRPDVSPDRGWAAGFPDVPAAAGAAAAWEYLAPVWAEEAERHRAVVDRLRAEVPQVLPGSRAVGDPRDRLPHVVTFAVDGVVGEALVGELDRRGVMVATGSACTTDRRMPSQVLAAMGIASDATLRIALPYGCTDATVDLLLSALPEARAAATA